MSPDEAERLAIPFGLTYLSREGYAKLAELLDWVVELERGKPKPPPLILDVAPGWREG